MNVRSKLTKSTRNYHHQYRDSSDLIFTCLNGNDVISSQVSDHHPTIHHNTLFWNIMMQGKMRNDGSKISYNNGFALIESDRDYQNRLKRVARVIAEIIAENPMIDVFSICEGPIKEQDLLIFNQALFQFEHMKVYMLNSGISTRQTATIFPNWGLLLYTNQSLQAQLIDNFSPIYLSNLNKLANRVQVWRITNNERERVVILAHLPFSHDTYISSYDKLSPLGKLYCNLFNEFLKQYSESDMTICADFNFNPNLIGTHFDRLEDKICPNNSILLASPISQKKFNVDFVTVDGILLSRQAKQKSYLSRSINSLFYNLSRERQFLERYHQSQIKVVSTKDKETQNAHDERYGLVLNRRN